MSQPRASLVLKPVGVCGMPHQVAYGMLVPSDLGQLSPRPSSRPGPVRAMLPAHVLITIVPQPAHIALVPPHQPEGVQGLVPFFLIPWSLDPLIPQLNWNPSIIGLDGLGELFCLANAS